MEIRNLITFVKILELGSFSKAADVLGYSQSTVTMQIKQLEKELNMPLFDRVGRKTIVNNDGLRFSKYAKNIILEAEHAIADMTSSTHPTGELRIGILESICTAHLPQILNEYHTNYPDVKTIIKIGTFHELQLMLQSGQIDLLWTFDYPIHSAHWNCAFSYESPIVIVCSPSHHLSTQNDLTLASIADEPFILTEKDCSYRTNFVNTLSSHGIIPNIFVEIGSTEIIKKFVESNLGLAVLPLYTVQESIKNGSLTQLTITDYQTTMYEQLFYRKDKWLSFALQCFIDSCSSINGVTTF